MAENEPTSTVTPSAPAEGTTPATATLPTDTQVVNEAAAGVADHIVPADEQHIEPQELMGGEVAEPEHADEASDKPYEPFGVINSRP
ncbi:hypothetical protein ACFVHB_21970 [Kitasatospora sp. NPDC127111]|uniref:hypothetical protein n=1 Tax=Kitasatospora sp. NPDC127111 TaxID=3345363 RepID=UPI0036353544